MRSLRETALLGLALLALACVVSYFLQGCGGMPAVTDPEFTTLSKKLSLCRQEARDARDAGAASPYMKYEDCKRREHVEGVGAP